MKAIFIFAMLFSAASLSVCFMSGKNSATQNIRIKKIINNKSAVTTELKYREDGRIATVGYDSTTETYEYFSGLVKRIMINKRINIRTVDSIFLDPNGLATLDRLRPYEPEEWIASYYLDRLFDKWQKDPKHDVLLYERLDKNKKEGKKTEVQFKTRAFNSYGSATKYECSDFLLIRTINKANGSAEIDSMVPDDKELEKAGRIVSQSIVPINPADYTKDNAVSFDSQGRQTLQTEVFSGTRIVFEYTDRAMIRKLFDKDSTRAAETTYYTKFSDHANTIGSDQKGTLFWGHSFDKVPLSGMSVSHNNDTIPLEFKYTFDEKGRVIKRDSYKRSKLTESLDYVYE